MKEKQITKTKDKKSPAGVQKTKTKNAKKALKTVAKAGVDLGAVQNEVLEVKPPVANGKDKKKGKKQKKAQEKSSPAASVEPKELSAADLKKIEKKKAKNLAQKLRKQAKKELKGEAPPKTDTPQKEATSKSPKKKKNKKPPSDAKPEETVAPAKTPGEVNAEEKTPKQKKKELKKLKKKAAQTGVDGTVEPKDPIVKGATVFVGNLPINTKSAQIKKLFEDYKPVNSIRFRTADGRAIFKHKTRKEAGTLNAYVVLADEDTATRALALNGNQFKGNYLRVTPASKDTNKHDPKTTLFVGNLKYSATEDQLRQIFSSCGDIEYVRCLRTPNKGCNGVAYVCFKRPESVGLSLELNETMLDERPIHVERYSVRKLGAKQARIDDSKTSNGAGRRLAAKGEEGAKKSSPQDAAKEKKSKKGEFRGVKVDGVKKKSKKKKPTSEMQQLAKKIAPKAAAAN